MNDPQPDLETLPKAALKAEWETCFAHPPPARIRRRNACLGSPTFAFARNDGLGVSLIRAGLFAPARHSSGSWDS